MVEPFVLPEATAVKVRELCRFMPRPAFELFHDGLQAAAQNLEEQVQMRGHHDELEHVPIALLPKGDGFHHHFGDRGLLQVRSRCCAIQPLLHFGEDVTRNAQPALQVIGRKAMQFF